MARQDPAPVDGRLGALHLRAPDAARAASFFSTLLGAGAARKQIGRDAEQRIVTRSDVVEKPIDAMFTTESTRTRRRLCFLQQTLWSRLPGPWRSAAAARISPTRQTIRECRHVLFVAWLMRPTGRSVNLWVFSFAY